MRRAFGSRRPGRLHETLVAFAILFILAVIADRLNGGPGRADHDTGGTLRFSGAFTVVDGDTLSIGGERLRLAGIDAPEMAQTCHRANGAQWACGQEATRLLNDLMTRAPAVCSGAARDRYHRLLVTCVAGERTINAEVVRRGMAVAYGGYQPEQVLAQAAKTGIWAGAFERPQDWRRHKGQSDDVFAGWVAGFFKAIGVSP